MTHLLYATLNALALLGCGSSATNPSTLDTATTDLPSADEGEVMEMNGPLLQAIATAELDLLWPDERIVGTIRMDNDSFLYLAGDISDVERLLAGEAPEGGPVGVLVAEDGACLGSVELEAGQPLDRQAMDLTEACLSERPHASELLRRSATLTIESTEDWQTDEELAPPPSCTSSCGSSEGYSYAGQTAYSNGSTTGTGSSCTTTGTYGYRYQCVEFTERVAGRSDWAGNAYTGYWTRTGLTSSTQGPYYKGLLPLGSGTGYLAPQAGDVVVWSGGTYGHVGVIASVGSSSVTVYDQNRRCGDQRCALTYSTSGYTLGNGTASGYCGAEGISSYTVRGYLHRGWDFGSTYGLASSSSTGATSHNWWLNDSSYTGGTTSSSVTDITDYITINPGTSDPYMTSPSGLAVPAYSSSVTYGQRYVSFYIKSECTNKNAKLYWKRTTDSGFSETRSVTATISGSDWQTLTFNPSTSSSWSGTIDQIRLDPASSCSSGSSDGISLQSAWFWR